ncbi:MAG: hypothetical protein LBH50_03815, partial [Spirochaetaceae bacterium]|nr:hypothetical protein [Spirochaetaceae bacterium]
MMDFFNVGNLLTLGIVAVAFLLFRYLDRNNRNISLARTYGRELKDEFKKEFGEFTESKAAELRNYGVILDGDFKRAEALKKNIEECIGLLEKKAVDVNELGDRIDKFELSLKDLDSWTERVEENLRRIEAESRYIEEVAEKTAAARNRLNEIDKNVSDIYERVQAETGRAVSETSGKILQSVQADIDSLKNTAIEIGHDVEGHREAIMRAEAERKQTIENDLAVVNGALQKVMSAAAERSGELEAEMLREINELAEKRTEDMRRTVGEKIAEAERAIADRIGDTEKSIEAARQAWQAENDSILDEQRNYKNGWRQTLEERIAEAERAITDRISDTEKAIETVRQAWKAENDSILDEQQKYKDDWQQEVERLDALALDQRKLWQSILDESDEAIDQYRRTQQSRLDAVEGMADDVLKLDAELRLHVENVKENINSNFTAFTAEIKQNYDGAMEGFNKSTSGIQNKIDGLEKEISALRSEAYEKVSGNLKEFEQLIESNLTKRSENINYQIDELHGSIDKRLKELTENVEAECRKIEHECGETLRQKR